MKCLILFLLFLPLSLTAQTDSSIQGSNNISFSIGEGIPFGNYGSNYNLNTGETTITKGVGYANTGPQLSLSTRFDFKNSNFGLILMTCFNSNSFDVNTFAINEIYSPFSGQNSSVLISNLNINNIQGGNYLNYSFLMGLSFDLPFKPFSMDCKFLLGVLYCQFPSISFSASYYSTPTFGGGPFFNYISEAIQTTGGVGLAEDIGIAFKYHFKKKILIILSGDILQSSPTINPPNYEAINMNIWLFNYSLGLEYRI
jgi:hypothetical protein